MRWKLPAIVLLVGWCTAAVQGIIPGDCVNRNNGTLSDERCCPEPPQGGGECGSGLSSPRGQCAPPASGTPDPADTDARKNWPNFFTHLCKCNGNYYGYNCGECKFGYTGDDCSERVTRTRKSVTSMTDAERTEYLATLHQIKTEPHDRFWVIKSEDPLTLVNVPLYDLFAWVHHYTARENLKLGNPMYPDGMYTRM